MRILIADDEQPARRRLVRLLGQIDDAEVVGQADSGLAVLAAIGPLRPDLILLDISMPELDGLELAARHANLPPIVFVTAHDEHAIRAFEVDAVDYLLKPVSVERLAAALQRVRARSGTATALRGLQAALPPSSSDGTPRIVTHERGAIRIFDARTIDRFRAVDKYTAFIISVSADPTEHLTEEPLSSLEDRLRPFGFLRVHRSELIRLAAIRQLTASDGIHEALLTDGQTVRISRRLLTSLKLALGLR